MQIRRQRQFRQSIYFMKKWTFGWQKYDEILRKAATAMKIASEAKRPIDQVKDQ